MSVPWNEIAPLNDGDTDSSSGEVEVIHLSDDAEAKENQTVQIQPEEVAPQTLLEVCARFIGQNFPFELVQLHPQRVPEEVQKRIAYWSFPLEEKRLLECAKTMHGIPEYTISRVMEFINGLGENKKRFKASRRWNYGWDEDHYDSYVEDYDYYHYNRRTKETSIQDLIKMTQIGMHLSGTVENFEIHGVYHCRGYHDTNSPISMCVQFDRGRITLTMCSCRSSSKWCEHVILLCIARIRGIVPCEIYPPMSEILSHFNRDQLQKLIQHFLEKVLLVGIPPVMALVRQLKDKESEINKQHGAPDPTAGGCTSEAPRWQIDEQVVISLLQKGLQNLNFSKDRITGIQDFKDFAAFLQNHDENITTAFKWCLETIDRFHNNRELESSCYGEDRYGDYYYSREGHPLKRSNLVYLLLMQGLQIFFIDPFISKSCKEEIADLLKSQDAFTLSEPTTEHYTSLLQEAVLISKESPQPTLNYVKKLQLALQGDIRSTDSDCREGSDDRSRILLISLVAVLRYWLFHNHPCNSACSAVTLDICQSVFPSIPLATSTFEDLVVVNTRLEGIQISSLLRHGQALMEYLIHSGVDQQKIVEFATKLLGASSLKMSAIVQTSQDTSFFVTQMEETILCLAQQHISCERESFTPVLRQIVKEYLHRDVGEGVFIWPWSLLRLAALDPVMVEEVREVTQNYIGNANSILHCTSQTDQVYPPYVVDLVRDSLLSLLQHLFNTLQPDSAQVLFTTLSNAFPFPITYSDGNLLRDGLQDFSRSIDYKMRELQELKKRMKVGVLPHLQCDPSLLCLVQQNSRFLSATESIRSILLKAVSAKYSIDSKHVTFIQKLSMLQNHRNHPLLFQLELLYFRVLKSISGYYGHGSYNSILTGDHKLQLDTPSGQKAFLYLVDNWQYCLNPSEVLDVIASRLCTDLESNVHEDEVAQLISTVSLADKDAVKLMRCSMESLFNILARSQNPEHLLNFVDNMFDTKSGAEELQYVGRALGQLYSRIKGRGEEAISDDDHLVRLKSKFMTILEIIITRITEEDQHISHVFYGYHFHGRRVLERHVNVREWAPLVCAIGGDAIKKFLIVLSDYHEVNSFGKFSYSFCQDLGILWREYSTSLPSGSPSILSVPAFEKITTHLLPEKEENARSTIKKYRNNAKRVKEAMLLLASIYQPLQLEKEFNTFAFEMSTNCSEDVKRMIVRRFVNTPLSAIQIPTAMLNQLSLLDEQGTACHQVDKRKRDRPREPDDLGNAHIMQQLLYYAGMREQYEANMSSSFWSGYGGYYDDVDYDVVDSDEYGSL